MTSKRPFNTNILELISSNVTGISTLGVLRDVLSHHIDVILGDTINRGKMNVCWSDTDLHFFLIELTLVENILRERVDKVHVTV